MKKYPSILVLIALLIGNSSAATAVDELAVDPSTVFRALQPTAPARGVMFIENMESLFSIGYIRYTTTPEKKSDGRILSYTERDWKLCNNWSDENCTSRYRPNVNGYIVLGSCISATELGCVESFNVTDSSGKDKNITLVGAATSGVTDIPESKSLGIPRSSARPLYKDSQGNLFVVRASMHASFMPGTTSKTFLTLGVDVTPVQKIRDAEITAPEAKVLPNNVNGLGIVTVTPTHEECIAIDVSVCYKAVKADLNDEYSLQIRVPSGVSGWMNGRLVDPRFTLKELGVDSQVISVNAKPAKMPIAGGWATYSELPDNFLGDLYPPSRPIFEQKQSGFFVSGPSQGDQGLKEFLAWLPFFKDRAIATVTNWSFASQLNTGQEFCVKSGNEIAGIVASNASVYSSRPPTWDAQNSTLTYQVASPHLDENGEENVGTYTLAIAANTIRCLYNQSTLPPSATVSVGYGSDVVTVATVTIKADSGWVYFSANGFHYSSPSIQVKFAKPVTNSTAVLAPRPDGKAIQWCAKGSAKKKVTAVNPTCPAGYKKIKTPL